MKNNNDNELKIEKILSQMGCEEGDFDKKEPYKKPIDAKNMPQEYAKPYTISVKVLNCLFEKGLENSTEFDLLEDRINRVEKLIELQAPTIIIDAEIRILTDEYNKAVDLL